MAGRPKKSTMFTDITDISSTEEKKEPKVSKTSQKIAEKAQEPSYRTGVVQTDSWLNVRSGPSPSNAVIGKLDNGTEVTIYETNKNWGKISVLEDKWVNLDFIV